MVEHCGFEIVPNASDLTIRREVPTTSNIGVEMKAMTGASVAALMTYDMREAVRGLDLHLVSKIGGKSSN